MYILYCLIHGCPGITQPNVIIDILYGALSSFILLSAGKGLRFGKETPKQYLLLSGKPMIVHSLERVDRIEGWR